MRILESGDDQPAGQMQPLYAPGIVTFGRHPFQYVSFGANCQYPPVAHADCLGPTSDRVDRIDVGTRNYQVSYVGQRGALLCCGMEDAAWQRLRQNSRRSRILDAAEFSTQQAGHPSIARNAQAAAAYDRGQRLNLHRFHGTRPGHIRTSSNGLINANFPGRTPRPAR
jgi:hypothetical protein